MLIWCSRKNITNNAENSCLILYIFYIYCQFLLYTGNVFKTYNFIFFFSSLHSKSTCFPYLNEHDSARWTALILNDITLGFCCSGRFACGLFHVWSNACYQCLERGLLFPISALWDRRLDLHKAGLVNTGEIQCSLHPLLTMTLHKLKS